MKILVRQPSRISGLAIAALVSLFVHAAGSVAFWYYPLIATAIGLRNIEFVDEAYDKAILIDFSKRFSYPPGYIGFRPPDEPLSLEEIARREKVRRQREEKRRVAREREAARRSREATRSEGEGQALVAANRSVQGLPTPTPTPPPQEAIPGGFGKINTAPIRDQVQSLYNSYKAGKIVFPEGKLKVGVSGRIMSDGTLADCKIIMPSGLPDIDRAALAILDAVSASRALGPLHEMTSLTMVLKVGEYAELSVAGFTSSEQAAINIVNLANAALLYARFKKATDPGTMVIINNLKVSRSGQRVQAIIAMPRQKASDSLAQTMGPGKT